ncbi:MAG: DUF5808 domain-containing protein [Pedobacter agri]|uniref:DUF5808 domain-containing protein n=1 Tax=Pedobacter agri TaxID=454586 RepID=UPI002781296E|nr:DUF5808 domain-containing protein [Pedobacter agri]MDQ1138673.1 putative membrane protein [Pedobacter agri]
MMKHDFDYGKYSNWKLGLFYFNKKDSRLFVPKRIKILGWTLNFANPLSYLVMGLIFLLAFILSN